jgi:hypothetical protein
MANYVELHGIRTWYDEQGTGEPLVLLHPGGVGVDSRAFEPNLGHWRPISTSSCRNGVVTATLQMRTALTPMN